ncbi:MAG: Asp23/Gls24 family envelope stress response protein [Chlamydiae bacterium]|nr:Asp23/Gls24 family envelope stress response protein [Chlamydiota bacterium]
MHSPLQHIDTKEVELPDTVFIRDIEGKVFQSIAVQCLSGIDGVAPLEGSFLDSLLGRDSIESLRGVCVEQDPKNHSVALKIELNVAYGVSIPQKAEEVQMKILEQISSYTGLHVSRVHVIFKNLISPKHHASDEGRSLASAILDNMVKDPVHQFSPQFE